MLVVCFIVFDGALSAFETCKADSVRLWGLRGHKAVSAKHVFLFFLHLSPVFSHMQIHSAPLATCFEPPRARFTDMSLRSEDSGGDPKLQNSACGRQGALATKHSP